jgi:hypothetical protein
MKSQNPNSPYSQFMQKVDVGFKQMLNNGSTADVVLNAVTSENPSLRYLAGKDIETLIATKRNMSDEEFYSMIKQTLYAM